MATAIRAKMASVEQNISAEAAYNPRRETPIPDGLRFLFNSTEPRNAPDIGASLDLVERAVEVMNLATRRNKEVQASARETIENYGKEIEAIKRELETVRRESEQYFIDLQSTREKAKVNAEEARAHIGALEAENASLRQELENTETAYREANRNLQLMTERVSNLLGAAMRIMEENGENVGFDSLKQKPRLRPV
ncbi:hypothetical protein K9U39_04040 [Rhodoblastus acidophilus]|uniref:Uncharacterized protein n=1 Tax=Candidatus Rhodoblastus alkanivorans TaxID=2954117 RepID=A0ABS9Z6W8_9HYPH|nr:hypothetical protein [Candidatus Rhodoblastus alkanivorans]MCI4680533.1 hypothetical protein [Candidatus Rhodoblastus alkanivorans]MCI4682816.1 hypothetical protein [Candidatus Rhodoblastus alkanivorans]MDI4640125.1 hypothetical protein [Rhodoblastus acidophilus]